jgi:hypothetical protein
MCNADDRQVRAYRRQPMDLPLSWQRFLHHSFTPKWPKDSQPFLSSAQSGNASPAERSTAWIGAVSKRTFAIFILLVGLFMAASATGVIPIRVR